MKDKEESLTEETSFRALNTSFHILGYIVELLRMSSSIGIQRRD